MTDKPLPPKGQSVVYVVEIGKHIKIGFSRNFPARLNSFRNAAVEVQCLLTLPGDRTLEKRLHKLLSEARIAREIFRRDRLIFRFIEHVEYSGLERGLEYLQEMTPASRHEFQKAARVERVRVARLTRAQENAYYASLVAERKRTLGW